MHPDSTWTEHDLPGDGETHRYDLGPLTFWVRRVKNEVRITSHHADDGPPAEGEEPSAEADWHRWALRGTEDQRLRLTPVLPDRMLVVKVEQPFTLLSRAEARIYMRVGAWVRVEVVGPEGADPLDELPTERLSDTWWGDFLGGEVAYWLTTKARRELTDDLFEPWLIMCTLQLSNRSADDLSVEKLGLRMEHLSVFEKDGRLWAEETRVDYRGEDEGSDIRMDDLPPREAEGAREIGPARSRTRSFRARTFSRLRAITSFGWGD